MSTFKQNSFPIVLTRVIDFGQVYCKPLKKSLRIAYCAYSNVAFLKDCPTDDVYKTYYQDDYWQQRLTLEHVLIKRSIRKSKNRLTRIKNVIRKSSATFPERPHILDVGCGMAFICAGLSRHLGADGFGIEPSKYGKVFAEQNGVRIIGDSLDTFECNNKRFDVISMIHVLEHMPRPDLAVDKLTKCIKKGGKFILEVPDLDRIKSVSFGHPFCFSVRSLYLLLNRYGFRIDGVCSSLTDRKHFGVITIIATYTGQRLHQEGIPRGKCLRTIMKQHKRSMGKKVLTKTRKLKSRYTYMFRYLVYKFLGLKI